MARTEKCRVAIDFNNRGDLLEWVEGVKAAGMLPDDAVVFMQDGLDTEGRAGGITPTNTFVVKRKGDRGEQFELQEEETRVKEYNL